jgi:hypothetical protein
MFRYLLSLVPLYQFSTTTQIERIYRMCFLISPHVVGVEESIVNALYRLRITDQLFKS